MIFAGRTHLLRRGAMTGVRKRDDVLDVYVKRYAGVVGQDLILMYDNAQPHKSGVVDAYFMSTFILSSVYVYCRYNRWLHQI